MSNISLTGGGGAGGSGSSTSGGSTAGGTSNAGGGGGGGGLSWIGDIVKVVGGVATGAFAMDQKNRAYKYDLYARPEKADNKMLIILLVASAVLIITVLIIFAVKAPKETN